MKRTILLITLLLLALSGFTQVNGSLTTVEGKTILKVWGTHSQRGFAHGYLLAHPMLDIFNGYILPIVAMNNSTVYNQLLNFYLASFNVETKYVQEAQGMVSGMAASGADMSMTALQRDVMAEDILLANCIVDLIYYRNLLTGNELGMLGCASLSSWGAATQADSLLNGHAVISRLMDWSQIDALIANPVLVVSIPAEADEQPWVSFTYPGLIGALSAISASGKAAFLNMGNVHSYTNTTNLHPILLSVRNAIEADDYNLDGVDNRGDILAAILDGIALDGTIIHALSENPTPLTGIIETNNSGTVMRTEGINSGLPGEHLAATNHFRLLASPVCCSRYSRIIDSLNVSTAVTAKRQMTILMGAAGQDNNMMTIQYTPYTGIIRWANATFTAPAWQNELTSFSLADLVNPANPTADDTHASQPAEVQVFPNPLRQGGHLTLVWKNTTLHRAEVYNLKGQLIQSVLPQDGRIAWNGRDRQGRAITSGVYLLKVTNREGRTGTAKLLYLP